MTWEIAECQAITATGTRYQKRRKKGLSSHVVKVCTFKKQEGAAFP